MLKRPVWIWTKKYNGWPFSAEWLSAVFEYNKAPFFQSFMEIAMDPAQNKIRLKAHGIRGLLQWSEMEYSRGLKPVGWADSAAVEWVFPIEIITGLLPRNIQVLLYLIFSGLYNIPAIAACLFILPGVTILKMALRYINSLCLNQRL